jgi:YfiR/HmsC-like
MSAKTFALAAVFFLSALPGGTRAETPVADEYEIKAAMLANLFILVDWPSAKTGDASSPFIVGVAGSDDMETAIGRILARTPGKTRAGHQIVVKKISGVDGVDRCEAVFVGGSDRKRMQAVIQALGARPVLTIGESDRFLSVGGMVGLMVKDDRVQVEVNLAAAQSAGLSISSRLLRIAAVRGTEAP